MWVKNLGVTAFAVALVTAVSVSCGEGEGDGDLLDVDQVVADALRAVSPAGKVGHLVSSYESQVQESWIDADNGRFRSESRSGEGEAGWFTVTVGEDWRTATYQSDEESFPVHITAVDRSEAAARGVDNLAYYGSAYLSFLAWADERWVVGEDTVDGQEVVVVETKRAMDGDWQAGTVLVTTVELDKGSLLPVGSRSKIVEPDGKETVEHSIGSQFEWEPVSPDDLSADFFSPDALFALYGPVDERLAEAGKLGFDLYWLGEKFEGVAEGQLDLYLSGVDTETEALPELRYTSETLGGRDIVIIREAPLGQAQLGPPPEVTGLIEQEEARVLGQPATLYSQTDRLSPTYEVTYRWLVLTLGETAIELYPIPMSEEGREINPLNNTEALIAVAEALVPVPAQP